MTAADRWFPIRLYRREDALRVQWFRRDDTLCFDDRYFHGTIARAAKRPFNLAFFRDTSVDALFSVAAQSASLKLAGLIAHLSRCGSTLVSTAFASRSDTLLLSEAGPINDALFMPGLGDEQRVELLAAIVAVLARPQRPEQRFCVIKLDAWHASRLGLLEVALPDVPWVFIHRDPVEVLVSHLRTPSFMMSGANAPATLGRTVVEAMQSPRELHCANVLAAILGAIERRQPDPDALVDYRELPEAIWTRIGPRFGLSFSEAAVERIRAASVYHAKDPSRPFVPDADEKRQSADAIDPVVLDSLSQGYEWFLRPIVQ